MAAVVVVVAGVVLAGSGSAFAQVVDVPAKEPPGTVGVMLDNVIGWMRWGVGKSAYLGFVIGAIAMAIGHFGENYGASAKARKWLLGAGGAMLVVGAAAPVLTALGG